MRRAPNQVQATQAQIAPTQAAQAQVMQAQMAPTQAAQAQAVQMAHTQVPQSQEQLAPRPAPKSAKGTRAAPKSAKQMPMQQFAQQPMLQAAPMQQGAQIQQAATQQQAATMQQQAAVVNPAILHPTTRTSVAARGAKSGKQNANVKSFGTNVLSESVNASNKENCLFMASFPKIIGFKHILNTVQLISSDLPIIVQVGNDKITENSIYYVTNNATSSASSASASSKSAEQPLYQQQNSNLLQNHIQGLEDDEEDDNQDEGVDDASVPTCASIPSVVGNQPAEETIARTGLIFKCTDKHNCIVIDAHLYATSLSEFYTTQKRLVIPLSNVQDVYRNISNIQDDDSGLIKINKLSKDKLECYGIPSKNDGVINKYKRINLSISTEDISDFTIDFDKPHDFAFKVNSATFHDNCKLIAKTKSPSITLIVRNNVLQFVGKDDDSGIEHLYFMNISSNSEKLISCTFSASLMATHTKCSKVAKVINVYIGENMPIVLNYSILNMGIMSIIIAPIENSSPYA